MEMSFLGSIGNLMAGSELQEVLQVVYASNIVNHMLSGKAVSRALREHLLVDAALHTIFLADAYNVPLPLEDDSNKPEEETNSKGYHDDVNSVEMQVAGDTVVTDLTEATLLYGRIVASDSTVSVEESCSSDVFKKLQSTLSEKKNSITTSTGFYNVDGVDLFRTVSTNVAALDSNRTDRGGYVDDMIAVNLSFVSIASTLQVQVVDNYSTALSAVKALQLIRTLNNDREASLKIERLILSTLLIIPR